MNANDPIARQTTAIHRANPRPKPTPYPGGVRARGDADFYADKLVGHQMAGGALLVVAELEDRDKAELVAE